jgi:alpha-mannosidase
MAEEPDSIHLNHVRHHWSITDVRVLERGPLRASIWVKLEGGNSRLELTLSCSHGRQSVDVAARVMWNERSARLKLLFPCGDRAEFQVPGATVHRPPDLGQVPGGRWVRVSGPRGTVGFASDALYDFDCAAGVFRATVCRASRYADDVRTAPDHEPWRPAVDAGELKFKFLLTRALDPLPVLSAEQEHPPVTLLVPPHPGKLGRSGSLGQLAPATLRLLALKPAEDGRGLILRLQETAGRATAPKLKLFGQSIRLPRLPAHRIATVRLRKSARGWTASATDATER